MDTDNLDLVRDDINAWRAAHRGRRGPLPLSLRHRAGVFAQCLGEDVVAEELELPPTLLVKWGDQYARLEASGLVRLPPRASAPAFIEVRPEMAAGNAASGPTTSIEVTRPDGVVVRVTGFVSPAVAELIMRSAVVPARGA